MIFLPSMSKDMLIWIHAWKFKRLLLFGIVKLLVRKLLDWVKIVKNKVKYQCVLSKHHSVQLIFDSTCLNKAYRKYFL